MNRLIRLILYITAGCVGIGSAALILSFVLSGGHPDWGAGEVFRRAKDKAMEFASDSEQETTDSYAMDELAEIEFIEDDGNVIVSKDESVFQEQAILEEGTAEADADEVRGLSVNIRKGRLIIQESDSDRIQVSCDSKSHASGQIMVSCGGGEMMIVDNRTGKQSRKDITVYLNIPENFRFETAKIELDAGEVEAECAFAADELTVNAGAGIISLENTQADELSASVGTGEIDMEDGVFRSVYLDCGVGTVDMTADISEYAKIDCGMGTVDLKLVRGIKSANYVLQCGVGSIDIGNSSYSGLSRETWLDNGASADFELNCGMGAISVEND